MSSLPTHSDSHESQETADLVTFTEESLKENFIFLYSDITSNNSNFLAAALQCIASP